METRLGGGNPIPDRVVEAIGFNPPPLRAAWQRPPGSGKPFWSSRVPQADPLQSLLVTRNPGNPRGSTLFRKPGNKQSVNEVRRPRMFETLWDPSALTGQGDGHENPHIEFGAQHTVLVSRCFRRKPPAIHNDQQGDACKRNGCLQEQRHAAFAAGRERVLFRALR